jgi:hypothetical protein
MKNVYIFLLALFIIAPLISSAPALKSISTPTALVLSPNIPDAVPQNTSRIFHTHVINATQAFYSGITCVFHIYNESTNGEHLYKNTTNTIGTDGDAEFLIPANVSLYKGTYSFKWICNSSVQAGLYEQTYYVTKNGFYPADDLFKMFIWVLFAITALGLFFTLFITIAKLATMDEGILDVLFSWSFLILTMIVTYLAENYLLNTFIENLTNGWLTMLMYTNGVLPLIAFVITILYKGFEKKRPLHVGEY